jgi:hypothetical protein
MLHSQSPFKPSRKPPFRPYRMVLCLVAIWWGCDPAYQDGQVGFRLVRSAP